MKRNAILAILIAFAFMACNKKKDDIIQNPPPAVKHDPTLGKDTTYQNRVMIAPKTDTVIASFVLDTKDAIMTAIGSSISFSYTGAFKPSDDLRNVYYVIKDGATIVYTYTPKLLTVIDGVNSFTQNAFMSFTQAKIYTIEVHADVLASATDNTGVDDQGTVTFNLVYQANGNSTNVTLSKAGQTITFSSVAGIPTSNLQIAVDPATPASDTIVGSQEIELLRIKMTSTLGTSIIDDLKLLVSDANASAVVPTLKVYDGVTPIGSASVSGQIATVTLNVNSPINVTKTFYVKAVIGSVNVNASGSTLKLTLDNVSYRDPSGMVKNNDTDRVSNPFVLLKAMQTITSIPLSGILQNNILADGNKVSILSTGGNTATKQLTYKVTLTDNATHTDTLSYKNLYFKIAGVVVNAKFTNSAGQIIDSIGPGDPIVRVTFSVSGLHEYVNPVNSPVEYVIGGRFTGFNHQSSDGDVGNIDIVKTDNPLPSPSFRFVNSGIAPNNISAKMWTDATANAGAVVQNYMWSDISAGGAHSFAFGNGSADAKNASIGVRFNTTSQQWLRPH